MADLDDVKQRILSRASLPTLIGETVKLTHRGGRPVGLCPFHGEKSPSFYVYDDRYYCFGCKAAGDAIEFIRKTQGFGYIEALRYLAKKFGIEAPELDEDRGRLSQNKTDAGLFRMMSEAQDFFVKELAGENGAAVREYLTSRGFTPESMTSFGFGLTPPEGFGLVKFLRTRGYQEADMVACSLATAGTEGRRPYDFFRRRIIIPIRDAQGRLIAFGGRTLDPEDPAKYKNSRDSKLFDKSRTLFGFDLARKAIREKGRAIIVEGYMDALQLWQAGFPETVACLGTAFTEFHLQKLKQATSLVILVFDGDKAGRRATLQGVNVALTAPEVHVKAVSLPQGQDPDDFVKEQGPLGFEAALQDSVYLLDFAVREKLSDVQPLAIPEMIHKEFVPWLARIADLVQRDFLTVRIAQLTGVPVERLRRELPQAGSVDRAVVQRASQNNMPARSDKGGAARVSYDTQRPVRPLSPAAWDLLGHLFYAVPHEFDPVETFHEIQSLLDLDDIQLALVREMTAILQSGTSPAEWPAEKWESTLAAENEAVLEKLRRSPGAFTCSDRSVRIQRSLAHIRQMRLKDTVAQLRREAARLSRLPGHEEELRQVLRTLTEVMRTPSP